ncbi:MAG TPA: rod shape-determining protein MreC [Bryobacteraceae bacterium]|jgi:rod shape-determining protein MreC|nr:rod shape-determining protein MreC [Bryobacteraceae bacterium]
MEALLSRYRNLTVLLVVVVAQLLYLAYQVRTNRDERLIRVWAVTAVTPMAGAVEGIRRNTIGFLQDYFILLDVREQNRKLKSDNDRLRLENVYFRNQLRTAEHASALTLFQAQSPSKTVAARVIGNSTVATAKAVFIDRGSTSGVEKGMAVVTPDGIVGKVVAVYPLVSQVLLITDPTFKVGVESQKSHVHGVLDCGGGKCIVEQIQNEDKVSAGEWFFTSGEDRIFPKGFPVGTAVSVQPGQGMKDVKLNLSGAPAGVEEVLVVLQGVHQPIPAAQVAEETVAKAMPAPPPEDADTAAQTSRPQTEADKVLEKYDTIGKEQNHVYGAYGSAIPNFNLKPGGAPVQTAQTQTAPAQSLQTQAPPSAPAGAAPAPKKPESQPAASTAALGGTPAPKASTPAKSTANGPVLPLGAPRHRAAPAPPRASSPPPSMPQQ